MYVLPFSVWHPSPWLEVFELHTDIINIHSLITDYSYIRRGSCEEYDIVIKNLTGNKDIIYVDVLMQMQLYTFFPSIYIYIYMQEFITGTYGWALPT